jgi:wobble nucleotide-excising tRNase
MIKKIKSISNLGVFKGFDWDKEVLDGESKVQGFKEINVIYGRNYSGKTTLSRILRAMETGRLSDKFENPEFCVAFADGTQSMQSSLTNHSKTIRVFNEDFVRDNLRFITNPDDSIEPFAILGEDNNKIEQEIEALEKELGHKEVGKETGLYAQRAEARKEFAKNNSDHKKASEALEKQLSDKATDRSIGIKYKPERFGDQNYNVTKLKTDIESVLQPSYQTATDDQLSGYEKLIAEKTLQPVSSFRPPNLQFNSLVDESEALVTKKISESDKLEELVKDAVLSRWVSEGRTHHKGKRENCGFCGSKITTERWATLEKHFDEESSKLDKDLDALIKKIETEKNSASSALSINNDLFYSIFHDRLSSLAAKLKSAVHSYISSLDELVTQLKARKEDLLNPKEFQKLNDTTKALLDIWNKYEVIRAESATFTSSLGTSQNKAKETLRLNEVEKYLTTICYQDRLLEIKDKKEKLDTVAKSGRVLSDAITQKEALLAEKKRELNDEEKGAKRVNEYLNNFFGHRFLSLQAKKDEVAGAGLKRIRFEVIRDGKKAYHLSEGECSLLAFCYFLAKLDDIGTKDSKPIIWIDDPISSLDGNHIFFIYSLLTVEIVSDGKFEQLFVSTHNLDFLKYLKRLNGKFVDVDGKQKDYQKGYFVVARHDKLSTIGVMPKYLKEYVTEFNYLFHQIHKCAAIAAVDDTNYVTFYNFSNNARKFFEIYLYYKYPDQGMTEETLRLFFDEETIPAVLIDRINNEYSHLSGVFERGSTPVEVPEMQAAARLIIERLKEDKGQYSALLKSIGETEVIP